MHKPVRANYTNTVRKNTKPITRSMCLHVRTYIAGEVLCLCIRTWTNIFINSLIMRKLLFSAFFCLNQLGNLTHVEDPPLTTQLSTDVCARQPEFHIKIVIFRVTYCNLISPRTPSCDCTQDSPSPQVYLLKCGRFL